MSFKPYQSKPITRMAVRITIDTDVVKAPTEEATYIAYFPGYMHEVGKRIEFKAYEEPKVGDWIVRLTDEDTYHVTDTVFRERNIVPEGE